MNNNSTCVPWDKKFWGDAMKDTQMDPALSNWLNGCLLCNFYKQDEENGYLCNRSFYNGVIKPPCNNPNFLNIPKNSADELHKNRFS